MSSADEREPYLDGLRAFSLLVVVLWHWVFTVIVWKHDGPHASNPIGSTTGLWMLTWFLQVMPVFFFVGGYVHLRGVQTTRRYGTFVARRLRRLLVPALASVGVAVVVRVVAELAQPDVGWLDRALLLVLSPLWFLCIYAMLVLVAPLGVWLHERTGEAGLVAMIGAVAWMDLARFHYHEEWAAWVNWVLVWATVHQAGFFYERLRDASPRAHAAIAIAGLGALSVLTNMGLYPRSMVGVPQESISNMGPPTLCILALAALQVGVVLLVQPAATRWLQRPRPRRALDWANRMSMPVFLSHAWGFALAYGVLRLVGVKAPEDTTWGWWAQRPLWAVAPFVATAVLIGALARRAKPARSPA